MKNVSLNYFAEISSWKDKFITMLSTILHFIPLISNCQSFFKKFPNFYWYSLMRFFSIVLLCNNWKIIPIVKLSSGDKHSLFFIEII